MKEEKKPIVTLTIAGSDSSGGAGIQADIKTMSVLGCFVTNVITGIVAENTVDVFSILEVEVNNITAQLRANFEDFEIRGIKIGALFSSKIIETVAKYLKHKNIKNLVVDPVMVAKNGAPLMAKEAIESFKTHFLPLTFILTPNLLEAQVLVGRKLTTKEEIQKACFEITTQGSEYVIIKGGHSQEREAVDLVCSKKGELFEISTPRLVTNSLHGTGCTFSAAITAFLAKGYQVKEAIEAAKNFVYNAIVHAQKLGRGSGPLNHFFILEEKESPKNFNTK